MINEIRIVARQSSEMSLACGRLWRMIRDQRNDRTIDLNPGATKNKDARVTKMTRKVHAIISMCIEGKQPEDRVFTREDSKAIGDFRKTWYKMCCNVGLGRLACRACDRSVTGDNCECGCSDLHNVGLLVHDLRRTGCRICGVWVCTKKLS